MTEQTALLRFMADAPVATASAVDGTVLEWRELSDARYDGRSVLFSDPGTKQRFEGLLTERVLPVCGAQLSRLENGGAHRSMRRLCG